VPDALPSSPDPDPQRPSRSSLVSRVTRFSKNPIGHLPPRGRLRLTLRGFITHDCILRAGALSFESMFAVVPLLALVVAILKGFGIYANLDRQAMRLWLEHSVGVRRDAHLLTLEDGINQILDGVEDVSLSSLGVIGAIALLYAVGLLFHSIESSFNLIFGSSKPRAIGRRLINYLALLLALSLLILAGSVPLAAVLSKLARDQSIHAVIHVGSVLVASLGLAAVMRLTPNVKVRWGPAFLGGGLGASLGYALMQGQVHAQFGVARYNLLYSGFAVLPLLLLWVYGTWIAVLLGAEVAAVFNDADEFADRVGEAPAPSPES
jgi:membrane protein